MDCALCRKIFISRKSTSVGSYLITKIGKCFDIKVKVIYDGREGDIINQYATFTKIYSGQSKDISILKYTINTFTE